jgi:L-asparaginase II
MAQMAMELRGMRMNPEARVEVWRGALVESSHRVHLAAVDGGGALVGRAGAPELVTYARSAVKPFQALPLVEAGALERLGLTEEELALCCASHSGAPLHVAAARSILARAGVTEDALACGAHASLDPVTARAMRERGEQPARIHSNCSGKHAGMLALARLLDAPPEGYHLAGHPVQRRLVAEMGRWAGVRPESIALGVDGCGVPTYGLTLEALARAFAALAVAAGRGVNGPARVLGAMARHPEYVAGQRRLCTAVIRATRGRVLPKVGAEGVYGVAIPQAGVGVALKVEDGGRRALEPALLAALSGLGLLTGVELAELAVFAKREVMNTRGEVVGRIEARIVVEAVRG